MLSRGERLSDILCDNQKDRSFKLLKILADYLPFSKAIEARKEIEKAGKDLQTNLLKNIAYPLFIFVFAYFMILFFSSTIAPSMQAYANNENSFLLLHLLCLFFTLAFLALAGFIACWGIFQYWPGEIVWIENFLFHFSFVKEIYSYQYAMLLEKLLGCGLSTSEVMQVMEECSFLKPVRIYTNAIKNKILAGENFMEILCSVERMDEKFKFFVRSGMETMDLPLLLELYCQQTLLKLKQKAKKLSLLIQCVSYGCVGVLVITVYQIMLMPLNMLNTF